MLNILFLFVIIVICLLSNGQNQKSRKNCVILCGIFLALVAGLRSGTVGTDTGRYVMYYLNNGHQTFTDLLDDTRDPGFYIFGRILYMIYGENYTLYLLTIAALFQIPVSLLIYKYSPNLLLSHLLLMAMGFWHFSMTGLRQTLAIAAVVCSIMFLLEGKTRKAIIVVLLGAIFHKSAVFFLIGIFMAKRKVSTTAIFIYVAITVLMIAFGDSLITSFLEFGAENTDDDRFQVYSLAGATLTYTGFIQLVLLFILSFFFIPKQVRNAPDYTIFLNMIILAAIMQSLAIYIAEFFRVAMYFSISMLAIIPMACQYIKKSNNVIVTGLELFLVFYYILLYSRVEYYFFWS